jgi:hypothetical protein
VAASRSRRTDDVVVLAAAVVAVLLVGALITAVLWFGSRGSDNPTCGSLNIGSADGIRADLEREGASFYTGGGDCGFWLAIEDGEIVAYRVVQPGGCTLTLRSGQRWACDDESRDPDELARYDVSIENIDDIEAIIVDLTPGRSDTTSTTATSTTS